MVFKLTVSVLGICHLLGLHFYLLISLLSSRAPNSSLHHSFSFLRDAVCLYQTWSRYLISDGQCCWCLNILLGLTSNPLDFVNLICTPHFGSFSQISAKWDPLFTICFPDTLNWQKVWKSMMRTSPPTEVLDSCQQLALPLPAWRHPHWSPLFCRPQVICLVSFFRIKYKVRLWRDYDYLKSRVHTTWGWLSCFLLHTELGFWVQRQNERLSSSGAAVGFACHISITASIFW